MENDLRDAEHLSLMLHQGPQTVGGTMRPVTLPSKQPSSTKIIAIKIST